MDASPGPMKALCLLPLLPALLLPGVGVVFSLAIVIVVLLFLPPSRAPTLSLRDRSLASSVALGVAAGVAVVVVFGVLIEPMVEWSTGSRVDLDALANIEGDLGAFLILLVFGLLFGGVVEEVIFRGYVVGWGAALFGAGAGPSLALLSAVVFGISHYYQGPAGMISTGLVGLAFGMLYLWTNRSLLPVIAAHMTVNAYGITLLYLGAS